MESTNDHFAMLRAQGAIGALNTLMLNLGDVYQDVRKEAGE